MAVFETDEVGAGAVAHATAVFHAELARRRERAETHGRRGWLVRRSLVTADALGITLAFAIATLGFQTVATADRIQPSGEIFLFLLTLPMWLMLSKLQGDYERDEERADNSTVDEFVGVLIVVTLGAWFFQVLSWLTGLASPQPNGSSSSGCSRSRSSRQPARWLARCAAVRARTPCERSCSVQATSASSSPARSASIPSMASTCSASSTPEPRTPRGEARRRHLFSAGSTTSRSSSRTIASTGSSSRSRTSPIRDDGRRPLAARPDVIVDVVPRLFELVGPRASMHLLEGLALVCVPSRAAAALVVRDEARTRRRRRRVRPDPHGAAVRVRCVAHQAATRPGPYPLPPGAARARHAARSAASSSGPCTSTPT